MDSRVNSALQCAKWTLLNAKIFLIAASLIPLMYAVNRELWCINYVAPMVFLVLVATVYCTAVTATRPSLQLEHDLLSAFSLGTTGRQICSRDTQSAHIGCLNGIRTLATVWIMCFHAWAIPATLVSPSFIKPFQDNFWLQPAFQGVLAVDVFFVVSGLLTALNWLQRVERGHFRVNSLSDWACQLRHRLLRLYPLYLFTFLVVYNVQTTTRATHQQATGNASEPDCSTQFWLQLAMLGTTTNNYQCAAWMWYVQNEAVYALVVPVFLLAFHKHRLLGRLLCVLQIVASKLLIYYSPQLGIDAYHHPACRILSYMYGLILADFVFRRQQALRDTTGAATRTQSRWTVVFRVVGWLLCALGLSYCVYGPWLADHYISSASVKHWTDLAYGVNHITVFSICTAFLIHECVFGRAWPLHRLLALGCWAPLAHVTYGAYMTHILTQYAVLLWARPVGWWGWGAEAGFASATVGLGFAAGLLAAVVVEYPAANVERLAVHKWTQRPLPSADDEEAILPHDESDSDSDSHPTEPA